MNKGELCKRKYIYRAYKSDDGNFHCERYPVAYQNRDLVYYVPNSGPRLVEVDRRAIEVSMADRIERNFSKCKSLDSGIHNGYFWNVDDVSVDTLRKEAKKYKDKILEREIASAKRDCEYLERTLSTARRRLQTLQSQQEGV